MRPRNHAPRFEEIAKMKLQAFRPSNPKNLQSQTSLRSKNRLPLNGLEGCSRPTVYVAPSDSNFKQQHSCRYSLAISPRLAPEFCLKFRPSEIRGRRECRAPDAPDSRVCNGSGRTHTR